MVTDISIFKNSEGKFLFVSQSSDLRGLPVLIPDILTLAQSYTLIDVGIIARKAISVCEANPILEKPKEDFDNLLKRITGLKSYKAVGKEWKMVSVGHYPGGEDNLPSKRIQRMIEIRPSKFRVGAHRGFSWDPVFTLDFDCSNEELGATIIKAFDAIDTMSEGIDNPERKRIK